MKFFSVILFLCSFSVLGQSEIINIEEIKRDIENIFNINRLNFILDTENIIQQFSGENRNFHDATILALTSFLNDSNQAESPLAIVATCLPAAAPLSLVKENLRAFLNDGRTTLTVVSRGAKHKQFMPENQEKPEDNWIFMLLVPSLSDHIFWAIVPKNTSLPVYNYGFN